ncbi:MAG: hypothetical protein E7339_00645 [Clostridiales bacterium]|nr:hypothetical protein [Clostridiales bacterium]
MELITILSKYSVDCVATAIFTCVAVFTLKRRLTLPDKANKLLPFGVAFVIYAISALFNLLSMDLVISKSMTAGGLATVIYAFCGGYSLTKEDELKKLMSALLKTVVKDEHIAKITDEIIQGLNNEEDEHLITVKISDLIRANVTEEVTEEKIRAVATVFIQTYRDLAVNKKSV